MSGMAEGVADSSGIVRGGGVGDSRPPEPAPDPVLAPKGWAWDRKAHDWVPRKRAAPVPGGGGGEPGAAPNHAHRDAEDERRLQQLADDFNAQVDAGDPDPGWLRDDSPAPPDEPFVVDAGARSDVHALVALLYTVPAEGLSLVDPYCFDVLNDEGTTRGITKAVTDIVCGSPKVARWAVSASGLYPWVKLAIAFKPVAVAVLHHHILRDVEVEVDRENKELLVAHRDWSQFPAA